MKTKLISAMLALFFGLAAGASAANALPAPEDSPVHPDWLLEEQRALPN